MSPPPPDPTILLAVVEAQNEIASAALDVDAVMALVCAKAAELTGGDGAVVELVDGEEMVYRAAGGSAARFVGTRLRRDGSLSGLCVTEGRTLVCDDAAIDPRVDPAACARVGVVSMLCVPLVHRDRVVGVLKVISGHRRAFGERDEDTLTLLSGLIAAQLRNAQVYALAEKASREDAVTGLGNRQAYEERLAAEVARAMRHGRPLTLCLVDVDALDEIKDAHGSRAGDRVLVRIARALRAARPCDQAFRIGEGSFALLLPETSESDADVVLRRLDATLAVRDASGIAVTLTYSRKQARHRDAEVLEESVRELLERAHRGSRISARAA